MGKLFTIDENNQANEILVSGSTYPTGGIIAYGASTAPEGWLLCDGSAVSRIKYATLYGIIGDTYGSGDGSTTFNVPDLRNKFIEGANGNVGTSFAAGLPNITGSQTGEYVGVRSGNHGAGLYTWKSGAISESGYREYSSGWQGWSSGNSLAYNPGTVLRSKLTFNAKDSNSIYGASTTVQPPALALNYIIKA